MKTTKEEYFVNSRCPVKINLDTYEECCKFIKHNLKYIDWSYGTKFDDQITINDLINNTIDVNLMNELQKYYKIIKEITYNSEL